MIIVRLGGGLGNQLFQYALGRHLSIIHQRELRIDTSGYTSTIGDPQKGIRTFALSHFTIEAKPASLNELALFRHKRTIVDKVINKLGRFGAYYKKAYIIEPENLHFKFDEDLLSASLKDPVYIEGYWQSEKYFIDIEDVIRGEFSFVDQQDQKNSEMLEKINSVNSVALHIRHGDNATAVAQNHGVLPLSYYKEAIRKIAESVTDPHFFIFSDDPVWAQNNLKLEFPAEFVTHNGDEKNYEDLRLMSSCKHHIVGNSTFSWWGAWLGKKSNQIVIAPRHYHIGHDVSKLDFYPDRWIIV